MQKQPGYGIIAAKRLLYHIQACSIRSRSFNVSEKRKDHKGRILRTGESQRKDLIYQYRYTDLRGKRHTIYDSDLKQLREKEKEVQKILAMDIKNLQYLMGHSDAGVTRNVYTHTTFDRAAQQMGTILEFKTSPQRKSG